MVDFTEPREAAFVTFYSFKGGVGRSMALINVAGILAGRGFKVLALDMDLEAPGISYLMRHEANHEEDDLPGFIDLLSDACERGEEGDLFATTPNEVIERYSYAYTVPEAIRQSEDGLLRIMPAGRFDGNYQQRLNQLDLGRLYRDGQGQPLVEVFKQAVRESGLFDFVLIDSRTGFSDESGICTRDLGDYLVLVMGLNRQNQEGTAEFLRSLRSAQVEAKGLRVVISPVPNGEDELVEQREQEAAATLSEAFEEEVSLSLQIPYHPRLALTEEPHIFRRSRGYLYDAYVEIEKAVLAMLGMTAGALLKQVRKAVEAKDQADVLALLKRLVKLDNGNLALQSAASEFLSFIVDESNGELRTFLAKHLPGDSWIVADIAIQLHKGNLADADLFYCLTIEADPNDANTLSNYGSFLTDVRGNHNAAEMLYKRALDTDSKNADILGNYSKLLFNLGRDDEGESRLSEAWEGTSVEKDLQCELHFYAVAHLWNKNPAALPKLKKLLQSGASSKDWPLGENVRRSREAGHPDPEFVAALAEVVSGKAPVETLEEFEAWKNETF